LAKTQTVLLSFGQNSFCWPNKLRRKTQKREQLAENSHIFAVSKEQNNSSKTTEKNNV
jgi:hypothetical protein